jgi:glycosyltransferase involved in cell wall biosynthesis
MYNDATNVPLIYKALGDVASTLPYTFEFVFVNDGSTDVTTALLLSLHLEDRRVRVLEFSRNFGKEAAVSAGLKAAEGDAAIIIDSDMQHPPELIGEFIAKWKAGAEVVIGIRKYSAKESWFKRHSSAWYYRILGAVSHTTITPHATDFRLLDRCVIDAFNEFTERNRMTRGLIDWLGFKREYLHFISPERRRGESSYSYRKLVALAVNSFTSYSMFPLRLAGYAGLFILVISAPAGLFVITEKYLLNDPFHMHITGTAFLAIILLFLVGVVLACLGLISLYIAQIHAEVMNRPLYMLRKRTWRRSENPVTIAEQQLLSEALQDETPTMHGVVDDSEAS